jgi:hypothetical protein
MLQDEAAGNSMLGVSCHGDARKGTIGRIKVGDTVAVPDAVTREHLIRLLIASIRLDRPP